MNNYCLYSSLFDAYTYMQSLEDAAEREAKKRELIDRLNRLPSEKTEAQVRGTALNEIVDSLIKHTPPANGVTMEETLTAYVAKIDKFTFKFDKNLVFTLVDEFCDCVPQAFVKATISVPQGVVTLYGYADYVRDGDIVDLKTTSSYDVGKYRDHWQHLVYPYCLTHGGGIETYDSFTYLVAELYTHKDGSINAKLYPETYNIPMNEIESRLKEFLTYDFIPFLEDNRHLITDPKVFSNGKA